MQKFNETKQTGVTVPKKAAKSPECAEPVDENTEKMEESPVDSRQSPVGESNGDEESTAIPSAPENSMYCLSEVMVDF